MRVYRNRDGALVMTERTVNISPNKNKSVSTAIILLLAISAVSFIYVIKLLLGS